METKIAVRGLIVADGKLLLVKHKGRPYYALPGGKLDDNESMKAALVRELEEELGVTAKVGELRFINEFFYEGGSYSLEFFYEVSNGNDFLAELGGSHTEVELEEIVWKESIAEGELLPDFLRAHCSEIISGSLKSISAYE